jgi:hypothetical protein
MTIALPIATVDCGKTAWTDMTEFWKDNPIPAPATIENPYARQSA